MSETRAADLSVHERIEQQTATIIVLKKMRENLQPARTGILLRCEQAGQFITLQQYLVRDSSAVVVQVRFYLNVFTIHRGWRARWRRRLLAAAGMETTES